MDTFKELMTATKEDFIFTSPFIKLSAVNLMMECKGHDCAITGITSFRLRNFERGASDLEAIKILQQHEKTLIKNIANIHSKIYIFDSCAAVISSANLTPGGLEGNVELGVLLRDKKTVNELKSYIMGLISDTGKSFEITSEIIVESENILKAIPKPPKAYEKGLRDVEKDLFKIEDSSEDKIFQSGQSSILRGLSGWKKDVFKCLVKIKKDIFTLDEVYRFERHLFNLHPENRNVKPKIRQQLQILRDMGLIEFTNRKGEYRKLWK
ncbi:MAG: NgoFVII family restriction endonuclease [Deferribacteres bacterium]|nr:NgoFVII family restriction endonuclease [Deferribacteres bacterium]